MVKNAGVSITRDHRNGVVIWRHIAHIENHITRRQHSVLGEYGLTPTQFDVLYFLSIEPGLSQQALAEKLLVTKADVVGLINRLELVNKVERRPDPEDRRSHNIYLTQKGDIAFRRAAPALEACVDAQFDSLDAVERAELLRLVARLDRSLR